MEKGMGKDGSLHACFGLVLIRAISGFVECLPFSLGLPSCQPILFTQNFLNSNYLSLKTPFWWVSTFFYGPLEGALVKRNFSRYLKKKIKLKFLHWFWIPLAMCRLLCFISVSTKLGWTASLLMMSLKGFIQIWQHLFTSDCQAFSGLWILALSP